MGLQKRINMRLIKRAIGNKYVYEIEREDDTKMWHSEGWKFNWLTWFLKDWVDEMKKEVKRKLGE